ncbi:unnamed protein product [Closterium sp. NIES-65]|nr:unnamed protein product [Closterium sp. NIES-65]
MRPPLSVALSPPPRPPSPRPPQPPPPAPLPPPPPPPLTASSPPPRLRRHGPTIRRRPRCSPPRSRRRLRAHAVAASPATAARAAPPRGLYVASAPASPRPLQPPPPAPLPSAASSPPPRPPRRGLASRRRPRRSPPRPRRRLRARVVTASPAAPARAAPLRGLVAASAPASPRPHQPLPPAPLPSTASSPPLRLCPPWPRQPLPCYLAPLRDLVDTSPRPPHPRSPTSCPHPQPSLMATSIPSPSPLPPPIDISSIDKLQLAADKSAINWHSFVGSIRRVLNDAWIHPYRVLDVILRRPHALPPTEPDHPDETPPLPPPPGDPPLEPELQITADQATADADFIMRRRAYLIRKAEYDAAADAYAQAVAGRTAHLAIVAKYTDDMATFTSKFIAWSAADNRACTVILVDYVGRMCEVADRLEARQAGLSEPLQIHRLLFNLTPNYESRLHAFTVANPMADLASVEQWIIDTEVKLRTPMVNLTSSSLNATQPRKQGKSNGKGGGGGKGGSGQGSSGTSSRGGSTGDEHGTPSQSGPSGNHAPCPGTLPPCTYVRRYGPQAGTPCDQTTHPPNTCFKALDDAWYARGNVGTPPRWGTISPRPSPADIQANPAYLPAHLRLLAPPTPFLNVQQQHLPQQQQQLFQQHQPQQQQQQQPQQQLLWGPGLPP